MTTKQLTAQEQAQEDQQKFMDFMQANNLTLVMYFKTKTGDIITLPRALKAEYTGSEWESAFQAVRKNDNGNT